MHLCREGQEKLVKVIEEGLGKASASKKRARSAQETPPSAKKDSKVRKREGEDAEDE